jgi:hypothetical protein
VPQQLLPTSPLWGTGCRAVPRRLNHCSEFSAPRKGVFISTGWAGVFINTDRLQFSGNSTVALGAVFAEGDVFMDVFININTDGTDCTTKECTMKGTVPQKELYHGRNNEFSSDIVYSRGGILMWNGTTCLSQNSCPSSAAAVIHHELLQRCRQW